MEIVNNNILEHIQKPEIEQVQLERQELTFIGRFSLTAGLKLFCYSSLKNEINEVTPKLITEGEFIINENGEMELKETANKVLDIYSTDIYFECLNLENAERRVLKFKQGKIRELFNLKKYNKNGIKFY